jgi:hypothetical protein
MCLYEDVHLPAGSHVANMGVTSLLVMLLWHIAAVTQLCV